MELNRRFVVGGLAATILPLGRTTANGAVAEGVTVLEAAPGSLRLLPPPAPETAVWAYNGNVPGPLLRIAKGAAVNVRLVNKLTQPTSLTWHGVRIANAMAGVAGLTQKPVQPGESFDYRFTPPDAGLYWYHPHVFPQSAEQIGRGLYGLLLVDEPNPPPIDQDLIVVIDDWQLNSRGELTDTFLARGPNPGSLVTANSKALPGKPVVVRPGARLRLRLVNLCASRIAIVTLAGMNALVVAIDGQASEVFPPAADSVPIGPGARFEVMVDMPDVVGKTATLALRDEMGPAGALMTFTTEGAPLAVRPRADRLPVNPLLPTRIPLEKSIKVDLVIRSAGTPKRDTEVPKTPSDPWRWTINGIGSDGFSGKPLFHVRRGGAVTLAFVNRTAAVQQMHVQGHVFRILHDLDDGWDPYWRESILIAPGKTKHVAFVADNPGKWAIESLILDRQVTGMAAWFEVA